MGAENQPIGGLAMTEQQIEQQSRYNAGVVRGLELGRRGLLTLPLVIHEAADTDDLYYKEGLASQFAETSARALFPDSPELQRSMEDRSARIVLILDQSDIIQRFIIATASRMKRFQTLKNLANNSFEQV